MKLETGIASSRKTARFRGMALFGELGLLAALALAIVLVTWPWAAGFSHSFANHWDPPLHAWKVWNMADALLHGHLRPPGIDLNAYFPSSGSLYYESLYWPQALVAAPVLAATGNPVLAFHVAYLFFWAFSGLCFRWFLREAGVGRGAALFGAFLFVLIPYRTGYVVEFNMQLCFGLPLVLLFLARWARTQRPLDAALAAGAFCFQASSELYQAVFLGLGLPFVLLALGRKRWKTWFRSRRFWISAASALAVAAVFVLLFFLPYLGQLGNSVDRHLIDILRHEAEPFSYLASSQHMRWSLLPEFAVRQDEICLYPTIALLVLALAFLAARFTAHVRGTPPVDGLALAPRPGRAERILRILRAAVLGAFLLASFLGRLAEGLGFFACVYSWLPVVLALLSLAIPLVADYRNENDRLADGLCGAALFAYLMSFGERLVVEGGWWRLPSPLFRWIYWSLPFLRGFRVVSRHGIVVLLFLVAAAVMEWDSLVRRHGRGSGWRARLVRWSWVPLLALVLVESIPSPLPPAREATPLPTPFLDDLCAASGQPAVLAVLPGALRERDSMSMFRIAGTDPSRQMVFSWGGGNQSFNNLSIRNFRRLPGEPGWLHRQLASIWPECFILLDRPEFRRVHPDGVFRGDLLASIATFADPIREDGRFTLYRIRPLAPSTVVERWLRSSFVKALPGFRCRIVPDPPGHGPVPVSVTFQSATVAELDVPPEGLDVALPLDASLCPTSDHCELVFHAETPVVLEDFRLDRVGKAEH